MHKRRVIYTDEPYIDSTNVVRVLNKAMETHEANRVDIQFLFNFEDGEQPLLRKKTYRPDIDIECQDNLCHEITKFHEGFEWGSPITLIQRGERDSGTSDENNGIALLNEQYEAEDIKTKTQKIGKDVTICNLGYTHVDVNMDYEDGDSFFKLNTLNPYTTFVIKSSFYIDGREMLGVTYREDDAQIKHFTCYTKDTRFEIQDDKILFEEMNPLQKIPIIEWIANYDGRGIWEHCISDLRNLNILTSDFSNCVEQNMQCIWRANDVEFPTIIETDKDGNEHEVVVKPKNGEWLQTFTTQDGKTPIVEALTMDYDYENQLNNILTRRRLILQKCYVPQRNDDSGGSTGIAMQSAAGWSALDIIAESIQACQESCKMKEVKAVLAAIKVSPFVPADSPLLKLRACDIQPNVKRQKLSEMNTKVNSIATMIKNGIYGLHAIKEANFFSDPEQVWNDSKEMIEKYQKSLFEKQTNSTDTENKTMQDESDQITNSPFLSGQGIEAKSESEVSG